MEMLLRCVFWLAVSMFACVGNVHAVSVNSDNKTLADFSKWQTDVVFERLGRSQGLPHDMAFSVVEDADGFIWIGTSAGLARWDGYRLRVFRANLHVPGELPDGLILKLHRDPGGTIWLGTNSAGIVRFDPKTESFIRYPIGGSNGLSHATVRGISDDGEGGLYVATGAGLNHLDPKTGQITRINLGSAAVHAEPTTPTFAVLKDERGALWVSSSLGLFCRETAGGPFKLVSLVSDAVKPPIPHVLTIDRRGRLWVGTFGNGAFILEPRQSSPPMAVGNDGEHRFGEGEQLRDQHVLGIVEVQPGEVWLATVSNGIFVVDMDGRPIRRIQHNPTWPLSLPDNQVRSVYVDRSGQVWVTTYGGVARHDLRQAAKTVHVGVDATREGVNVQSMLLMPDGKVWLGTFKGSIAILGPDGVHVKTLRPDARQAATALPEDMILDMARLADGDVFVGTLRGLYRVTADGSQVRRVEVSGRKNSVMPTMTLLVDGNSLWIGGTDGLWHLDLVNGESGPMLRDPALELTDRRVTKIFKGEGETLWILTRNGLNRYEKIQGKVKQYPVESANGLSMGWVNCLFVDGQRNRVFVGTLGGGIDVLSLGGSNVDSPIRLTTSQGLPGNSVDACASDDRRRLWVSTDDGLAAVDLDNLTIEPLRRAEGAVFTPYWETVAKGQNGSLAFGGSGGLTVLQPGHLNSLRYRPPVVVTNLKVGGKDEIVELHRGGRPVDVLPTANSLAVEFAALDYTAPERNRYAYKLEGYDTEWVETDASRRLASYTNLPPGSYRLMLMGSNRDGAFGEPTLGVVVEVHPAWYQTWWFRFGSGLLLLAVAATVFLLYARLMRARQAELERKVRVRTSELETAHQTLREKSEMLERSSMVDTLTGLYNQKFLAGPIAHDLQASLRWVQEAVAAGRKPIDTDSIFFVIEADHLPRTRDRHGPTAVDDVLLQLGAQLRSVMRESDHLVRWGDTAFLAVVRETDRARAEELAESIRRATREVNARADDGRLLPLSCSIGFACLPYLPVRPLAMGWKDVVVLAELASRAAALTGGDAWIGVQVAGDASKDNPLANWPRALREEWIRVSSNKPLDSARHALLMPTCEFDIEPSST